MFNEDDMRGRYGATQMCAVLGASFTASTATFTTKGSVERPCFYMHQQAIIFTPSSDTQGTREETLDEVLTQARQSLSAEDVAGKVFLFPVAEEQRIWGFPRNHWVTLHYDPATKVATLIDSRRYIYLAPYDTTAMKTALTNGLAKFGMSVERFDVQYQCVQWDDVHCGAWTIRNIQDLADGHTVAQQVRALSGADQTDVIQAPIKKVSISTTTRDGSPDSIAATASVGSFSSEEDGLILGDEAVVNDEQSLSTLSGQFGYNPQFMRSVSYQLRTGPGNRSTEMPEIVVGDMIQDSVPYVVKIDTVVYAGLLAVPRHVFCPDGAWVAEHLRIAILNDIVAHGAARVMNALHHDFAYLAEDVVEQAEDVRQVEDVVAPRVSQSAPSFFQPMIELPELMDVEPVITEETEASFEASNTWLDGLILVLNYIIDALNWMLECLGVSQAYQVGRYEMHSTPVAA